MDADELRAIANEELERALYRFWARAENLPDVNEHFAAAVTAWVYDWVTSYLVPDGPPDPDDERRVLDELERARRDLELLGDGTDLGTAT